MSVLRVRRSEGLRGEVRVPGDKSISHRAVILGAIAEGETRVKGFLAAEDTVNTARAFQAMGVELEGLEEARPGEAPVLREPLLIHGVGLQGLQPASGALDMGNSGTGMRLLMGVLAGQPFAVTLVGDPSLSKRPMDRIADPLGMMGVRVEGQGARCTPPVTVRGGEPRAIRYQSPVASAQVKSAVLLAGAYAEGLTTVHEPVKSRDHTERMLAGFGAEVGVSEDGLWSGVTGPARLVGRAVAVPGDFSSAAYFLAAALLCRGSDVLVRGVLLNPTRTGLLQVLCEMAAEFRVNGVVDEAGEPVGNIRATSADRLVSCEVGAELIPAMIDEVPLLAVIASQAEGTTVIGGAEELRVKESDRIALVVRGLQAMGADVEERRDGMVVHGPARLRGATIDAHLDHRIAMSFAVAGMVAEGETVIEGVECIGTSFPGFVGAMRGVGAGVEEC